KADENFGMSPAVDVIDFISNSATKVRSIATNFNGLTNAARADSVYYLDEGLRLKATSPDSGVATGIDMNYNHTFAPSGSCPPTTPACGGSGSPNDRLLFVARFDANIDVFDTYFGAQVGTISIRDPIVGPLRVAKDASGNQLLFGITSRGVVMVSLPAFTNPLPVRPRRPHEDRIGPDRMARRRARGRDARLTDRHAGVEPRLGALAGRDGAGSGRRRRSEEHTSELQSPDHLVCRLLLEKKKNAINDYIRTSS